MPRNGHTVAIIGNHEGEHVVQLAGCTTAKPIGRKTLMLVVRRVGKVRKGLPSSWALALAKIGQAGMVLGEAVPVKNNVNWLCITLQVVKTMLVLRFHAIVANTLKIPISFSKNMEFAKLGMVLSEIVPIREEISAHSGHAVPMFSRKQNKKNNLFSSSTWREATKGNKRKNETFSQFPTGCTMSINSRCIRWFQSMLQS